MSSSISQLPLAWNPCWQSVLIRWSSMWFILLLVMTYLWSLQQTLFKDTSGKWLSHIAKHLLIFFPGLLVVTVHSVFPQWFDEGPNYQLFPCFGWHSLFGHSISTSSFTYFRYAFHSAFWFEALLPSREWKMSLASLVFLRSIMGLIYSTSCSFFASARACFCF